MRRLAPNDRPDALRPSVRSVSCAGGGERSSFSANSQLVINILISSLGRPKRLSRRPSVLRHRSGCCAGGQMTRRGRPGRGGAQLEFVTAPPLPRSLGRGSLILHKPHQKSVSLHPILKLNVTWKSSSSSSVGSTASGTINAAALSRGDGPASAAGSDVSAKSRAFEWITFS